ncbi:complex I subunit 5 family protein [Oligoflexus tunisiensis]|uniref:complex I subunit 5 family protein n=1 Tax=Oligoflexus tunisiensis TaxID=708132 RepID=UPI00114D1069|nr:complex I subunit 5 family protein [Oligoflexus tunisiensis]
MNTLLLFSALLPMVLAIAGLYPPFDRLLRWIYGLAPVPAFLLALIVPLDTTVMYPHLLLGSTIGLDHVGRAFLLLTAFLWCVSGLFSLDYFQDAEHGRRYRFFYLLTLSGNLGVTMAMDAASFYTFFGIMTLSGYGLVTQARTEASFSAGRFYLAFALCGEMLILAGIILEAHVSGTLALSGVTSAVNHSPIRNWIYGCIFLGFGIKVGLVPFHFWLPRAYYAAPLPATAILSGTMTKAGILGWIRFLPLGGTGSETWSSLIVFAGMLMAFYGVLVGLVQSRARSALAFSSLSQMGYLAMAMGAALEPGGDAGGTVTAALAFVFHHGVTKVTMFLGLSLLLHQASTPRLRYCVLGALVFTSLSLVGFPYTSGALAKSLLKLIGGPQGTWHALSSVTLVAGSVGTTLLIVRFLVLCWRQESEALPPTGRWLPWLAALILCLAGAWLLPWTLTVLLPAEIPRLDFMGYWQGFWPVLVCAVPALLLTKRIWQHDSRLTPRPLEGIKNRMEHMMTVVGPDLIHQGAYYVTTRMQIFISSLKIEERSRRTVEFSLKLQTGWRLGITLLLAIWFALWAFLSLEGM